MPLLRVERVQQMLVDWVPLATSVPFQFKVQLPVSLRVTHGVVVVVIIVEFFCAQFQETVDDEVSMCHQALVDWPVRPARSRQRAYKE